MQGRFDPQRGILDVESVTGHLLPVGGVFAFLAAHRHELFPAEVFADLFSSGGRVSVPAEVMASVIVLQTLHGLSDAETVEAVTFDLRWKAACGLAAPPGAVGAPEPDLRRGPAGGRRDWGAGREDTPGAGFHGGR